MVSLRGIFTDGGLLQRHLEDWEARPGQLAMARAIHELLAESCDWREEAEPASRTLVVEAGTGLGKTLAYLVPAVLSGRKVVVSTNTRNLQDQILDREIPFIREYIDPGLKAICVKGKQNYCCLYRWHQSVAAGQAELFEDSDRQRIGKWLEKTVFGDLSELKWLTSASPLWRQICCQSHFCLGRDCPHAHPCFLNRLRQEAAASQLLVVNHHLLFSDLAVRSGGYGEVLPRYEAVIFDEAHHVEAVATRFFGRSVSLYQIRELAGDLERSGLAELSRHDRKDLIAGAQALLGRMSSFAARFPEKQGRHPLERGLIFEERAAHDRDRVLSGFDALIEVLTGLGAQGPWPSYLARCQDLRDQFFWITELERDEEQHDRSAFVHWYERRERNFVLSATPLDVAPVLREHLYPKTCCSIFTSATLSTAGSFKFFLAQVGLDDSTPTLCFPSPFPYQEQMLLYIPEDAFPQPDEADYRQQLHERMELLVQAARGRSLLLFTSFHALDSAWHALEEKLDYPLLRQGSMPRRELLHRFSRQASTVLFAVASFWEGVDVPGESLSLVLIDKIPFEVPTDPVIMARMNQVREEGGNPFFDFQVPRAILTLRQGVGRLMRSSNDHGVVAILDSRLVRKPYGKRFLRSLPPCPTVRSLAEVEQFFQRIQHGEHKRTS